MFCKVRKKSLPLQAKVTEKLEQKVRQGILESVQPRGVTNASPVVWQRKKWRSETFRVLNSACQWQGHGLGLPNIRHGDDLPQTTWGLIFFFQRCLLSN